MNQSVSINKYWIYLVVISLLLGYTIVPKIWKAITFTQTFGVVRHFIYFKNKTSRKKTTTWYPLVDFKINNKTYSCYGSSLQHDELFMNDRVRVLYDPNNAEDAYVYSALGFWAPTLSYLIPLVLIISLGFGLDYIPKIIRIKLN